MKGQTVTQELLEELKEKFHKWLGAVSIEELMSNYEMIEISKMLERRLQVVGA